MRLYDLFKKKKTTQSETAQSETTSQTTTQPTDQPTTQPDNSCANDGRRFLLLAEDVFELKNDMGIVVVGQIHGTMKVGDVLYILHPGKNITLAEISGIEINQGVQVNEACNQSIALRIADIKNKSEIAKYSVLTSIRPQTLIDVNTAVENPYVLGMSLEYNRFCQDSEYFNLLIFEIAHANYLVPMYLDKDPEEKGDGTAVFTEGTTMSFPSLKKTDDESQSVFPVFTYWDALNRWESVFDEAHPPKTAIFKFPDCVSVTKKGHAGMVINPFGPNAIYIPMDLIDAIIQSEGYQSEYGENSESKVKEIKVEKETKIMVGLPYETEEVKMIKENLILFAKKNKEIKRIDFLLKIDEQNEKAYLCVVDCPEENAKKIFGEMYEAIGAYACETKLIDFVLNEKADFVRDVLEKNPSVYQC